MKTLLIIAGLLAVSAAQAQVYKCSEGGKAVFSDVPCIKGAEEVTIQPASGQWDARSAARAQAEMENLRAKVRRIDAIRDEKVYIGMKRADVLTSWGEPTKINRGIYPGVTKEQWVYNRGNYRTQYVYVENGVVTAIQDH